MRALWIAVLALALDAPAGQAFWSVIGYDYSILSHQQQTCPPRGPYPFGGCDQCLPVNHHPLIPLFQVFCGPDRPCRANFFDCDICNGSCAILWAKAPIKWARVLGDAEPVHDVIRACNQWMTQVYCQSSTGAYFAGESFSWIPVHQRDYTDLYFDPLFREEIAAYTGPGATNQEGAWRYRMGLFAEMARRAGWGPSHDHYSRAANLSAWEHVHHFAPPDQREAVLDAMGFPRGITLDQHQDLIDIHEATCAFFPFLDCLEPVDPATWGRIKHLYRNP